MTEKKENETPETAEKSTASLRKRRKLWAFVGIVLLVMVLLPVGGALYLLDRPVRVPEWAENRIEQALAGQGTGARVQLGEIYLTVGTGLRPWVELHDTVITQPDGAALARVSDMRVNLSGRRLIKGILAAEHVSVSGLLIDLKRAQDGTFELAFGSSDTPVERSMDFPRLISVLDTAFETPELDPLRTVTLDNVSLRYVDLRAERSWTVDGGRFMVERDGDDLHASSALTLLTGGATAATVEGSYWRTLGELSADFGLTVTDLLAQDIATQAPALAFFAALDAPLSGSLRGQLGEEGELSNLSASLSVGQGALRPNEDAAPVPFNGARTYFNYEPKAGLLLFDEVSVDSAWVTGRAEGSAQLVIDEGSQWPSAMIGQIRLSDLTAAPIGVMTKALDIQQADASFRLNLPDFALELGQMTVQVPEGRANISGRVEAAVGGWALSLLAEVDEVSPEDVVSYWPPSKGAKVRDWLSKNIKAGRLRDIQVHLTADPGEKPRHQLDFAFDGAEVQYLPTMPPIRNASGWAELDNTRFALQVDQAEVRPKQGGVIDISGSRYEIPKFGKPPEDAQVALRGKGTVTAFMSLLDSDPINVPTKTNLPTTLADGMAEVEGTLGIPFKPKLGPNDVAYDFDATIRQVRTNQIVKGSVLASESLTLHADRGGVKISGRGRFNQIPFDGSFTAPKGGTPTVSADVELSERALDALNIDLGTVAISGQGTGRLDLTLPKGKPIGLRLTSKLSGVGVGLSSIGWSKARSANGGLTLAGQLNPLAIDTLEFSAPGLALSGDLRTTAEGKVTDVRLSQLRVGNWLDSNVTLGLRQNAPPLISLRDGRVDISKMPATRSSGGAGSPLRLSDMTVQITSGIGLQNFNGDFETTGGTRGTFTANVNGGAPVEGLIAPSRGRSAIRVTSEDGGDVMRDAGILKQANGGEMVLTLTPARTEGQYDGVLAITNTRLYDAPAVTDLLNAVSVVGLLDQMANGGIYFSNVDAKFRLTPEQFILTESSAVGPSMGLSLDGIIGLKNNMMDLQGVLSPVYMLNGIGGIFTRAGEGLFGFNFTLTGSTSAPQVGVNPLSVLTPGMFREIFRRPPPKVSQ
ncbi:DUF3971 domain-containing protein [Donghicola sp.]|jgi:hypothetical protein|uniref:YhdP family protein n=1 Tax=Donghicola sp. TaxID=1929294 RepID=UPI0025E79649|nr:DUF3971 domain-containing protein [Donghicola sp.]MCT4577205.1 DUF3971 domain-containing protein [Donghicola sp.]